LGSLKSLQIRSPDLPVKQHLFQVSAYCPVSLCIIEEGTEETNANFSRLRKSPYYQNGAVDNQLLGCWKGRECVRGDTESVNWR
jgi:hypothetical protein